MSEISWSDYLTVLFIVIVLYYAVIFLKFWLPHMGKLDDNQTIVTDREGEEGFNISVMDQFLRPLENENNTNNPINLNNIAESNENLSDISNKESDNSIAIDHEEEYAEMDDDDIFPEDPEYSISGQQEESGEEIAMDSGFAPDRDTVIDFGNSDVTEIKKDEPDVGTEQPAEEIEPQNIKEQEENKDDNYNMDFSKFLD